MPSTVTIFTLPHIPPDISGQVAVVSLAVAVVLSSGYNTPIINHEAFQVLALTLGSIFGVAIVAGILICIPDFINGSHRSHHHRRGRTRHRSQRGSKKDSNLSQRSSPASRSKERSKQKDYYSSSSAICQPTPSRKKTPSMPPLPTQPRNSRFATSKSTPGLVPLSADETQPKPMPRRYSSPPSLQEEPNFLHSLNPIAERKLEDIDYDECWWRELDSRSQYYALILGYTPATWDGDWELEDLICEDWEWDEMTKEQKAAAQHFGYDEESWTEG